MPRMAPVRSLLIVVNVLNLLDETRSVAKQIAEPGQATSGACWTGVQYLQYISVVIEAVMWGEPSESHLSVGARIQHLHPS